MNKLLKILAALIVILFAAYFFLIDVVVKALLEREASQWLQTKVELSAVDFHLVPTSLTLRGLRIASPSQPARNLLEASIVQLPLDLGQLRTRQFIVDQMQVHGLRFNRQRADAVTTETATDSTAPALPDAGQWQREHVAELRAELQRTQRDLQVTLTQWQQRLRVLPDAAQLDNYHERARGASAATLARLRAEIRSDVGSAGQLQAQFDDELRRVQEQLSLAQHQPQQGFGTAPSGIGNTGAFSPLGALLLADLKAPLDQLLRLIATSSATGDDMQWRWLLRHVQLDGQLDPGSLPLRFAGTIDDVSGQPREFDVVTRFELHAAADQPGRFALSGQGDLRKTAQISARADIDACPVADLPLGSTGPLRVTVTRALLDTRGMLALTGDQFDLHVLASFHDAEVAVAGSQDEPLVRAAAQVLREAREFDLNLQVSGSVREPRVTLNSSLDPQLINAFEHYLQTTGAAAAPRELQTELDALRQLAGQFAALQQQLTATLTALQSLQSL